MSRKPVPLTTEPSVLTPRELMVLVALAKGSTNREVAEALEINIKTVDTHRGHALKKLWLRNNSDLTRYAIKRGLIDVDGNEIVAVPPASEEAATQAA